MKKYLTENHKNMPFTVDWLPPLELYFWSYILTVFFFCLPKLLQLVLED